MVKETLMKKALEAATISFVKSAGTEAGKNKVNGQKVTSQDKKAFIMPMVKDTVGIISQKYDWNVVNSNINQSAKYMKKIIPAITITIGAYTTVPVLIGAATTVALGASASAIAYSITNISVLAGGTYKIVENMYEVSKTQENV